MDEKDLQDQLAKLRDSWRVPRDVPLAQMWEVVEAQAFRPLEKRPGSPWIKTILPLAATLLLGFGLGQLGPALLRKPAEAPVSAAAESARPDVKQAQWMGEQPPFVGVATNYLERVTALLVTLTDEARRGQPLDQSNERARDLLATTRLLLDSPEITDTHLRDLLDDLELVLAQVVRLPRRAAAPDVYLIDQALDQREVLPRLRVILAESTPSGP